MCGYPRLRGLGVNLNCRLFLEVVVMRFGRVVLLGLCLCAAAGVPVWAVITGSEHDFSTASWNSSGETCVVCHAPHGGSVVENAPLWNHSLTTQSFTLYTSGTLNAADLGQPTGTTRLCLSCHWPIQLPEEEI